MGGLKESAILLCKYCISFSLNCFDNGIVLLFTTSRLFINNTNSCHHGTNGKCTWCMPIPVCRSIHSLKNRQSFPLCSHLIFCISFYLNLRFNSLGPSQSTLLGKKRISTSSHSMRMFVKSWIAVDADTLKGKGNRQIGFWFAAIMNDFIYYGFSILSIPITHYQFPLFDSFPLVDTTTIRCLHCKLLDQPSYRVKPCNKHPPWPEGICIECAPESCRINRQVKKTIQSYIDVEQCKSTLLLLIANLIYLLYSPSPYVGLSTR